MIRTIPIVPTPEAAAIGSTPYLWGRNRYAALARVEVWPSGSRQAPGVSINGYSKRSDDSPCHLSNLSPADARAIAAALLAAADDAEKEAHR